MICKILVRGDLQALSLSDKDQSWNAPRSTEAPTHKHAVSEGLMSLAQDKMPEATMLIGLS